MEHTFIHDLGLVTLVAALVSLVFHKLKMPVFLGYIVAGILLGPNFYGKPLIEGATVQELKELGVIFLMFYIGLEFDLRRLREIMAPAFIAVFLQTLTLIFVGLQLAPMLQWQPLEGVFLGSLLAISSSMVTVSMLQDMNRLRMPHGQMAVGILVLEDILAILLLVLLSGMGVSGRFDWGSAWKITFFIGVFVVVVFYVGRLVAPWFLNLLNRIGSMELITLSIVGMVLGVSLLAEEAQFSVALGAFLAGSILSQSALADEIEHSTEALRNIFCSVFFVSVGMLIDPPLLLANWKIILLLAVLVVLIKIGTCWLGLFLGGQRSGTAFRASVAKSQIGEFSFIIAGLGMSMGVTGSSLMTIAVGVSVLSSLGSLVLALRSDKIYNWFETRTPEPVVQLGKFYGNFLDTTRQRLGRSQALKLIKRPLLQILFQFFLVNGFILGAYFVTSHLLKQNPEANPWMLAGIWTLSALISLPFLIAIVRNLNVVLILLTEAAIAGRAPADFLKGRVRNTFQSAVLALVVIPVAGLYLSAIAQFLPGGWALGAFVILVLAVGFVFWRRMVRLNSQLEYIFMQSFNQQSVDYSAARREAALLDISQKYPWPVDVMEVEVKPGTEPCGQRIIHLDLRAKTGATIVGISREGHIEYDPGPQFLIFPGDRIFLFGSMTQNKEAARLLRQPRETAQPQTPPSFRVEKLYLDRENPLTGETLAGSNLRQDHSITVLGIQRGERRITAPSPEEILQPGDVLYVVGNPESIQKFRESCDKAAEAH